MMTKFLTIRFLVLTLLAASALTPTAYAKQPAARSAAARAVVQNSADKQARVAAEPFIRTELFFGTDRAGGPDVTEQEWQQFLDEEITPRFPDGLTVLTGYGQFRDASGNTIQERSFLLILLYPVETRKSSSAKIEQIREAYKTAFQQQSVLRVDAPAPVWVSF